MHLFKRAYLLLLEVLYFIWLVKNAFIYFLSLTIAFIVIAFLWGIPLTLKNITLFLTLNYEPQNAGEALCLLVMLLIELSPIMAFVEVRTLSYDDKAKIRAQHMRNHIVVIGCGHLGKRVTEALTDLDLPFVLIVLPEDKERNEYVRHLLERDVPVIFGDATLTSTLTAANIGRAKAIIISINNDYLNPVIADHVRKLNPKAKIIVRIYNDDIADLLRKSGAADEILSTSKISVLEYIMGCFLDLITEVPHPFIIKISENSKIVDLTVKELENNTKIKILCILRNSQWIVNQEEKIKAGDILFIHGDVKCIKHFLKLFS
ncbi:MAG: potassium channel family protein [Candidatus Baldrarchaeia archaeon]